MTTINEVCDALAEAVTNGCGLRAIGYIDTQVNPPQAQVFTRDFDPRLTLGGSPEKVLACGVRVFVRSTRPSAAQEELRGYMEQSGSTSVRAAIETSGNWTVDVDDAEVTNIGQPFEVETANETYWAVDFDVDVIF